MKRTQDSASPWTDTINEIRFVFDYNSITNEFPYVQGKIMRQTHVVTAVVLSLSTLAAAEPSIDFKSDVAPIFAEHCVRCHSPGNAKGDLSLARVQGLRDGGYLQPGQPDDSYLLELIAGSDDRPPEMPKDAPPLSQEQVQLIRQWITEGAVWPADVVVREKSKGDATWWSLQPIREPETGATIDSLIQAELAKHGLTMNPRADRRTLIRRVTYDLVGLPPTPEQVEQFVSDSDPRAYERLIDRLLASPHYGERWGRHWLDVVRFGESIGYERNVIIDNIWPFRDYVIRSLNEDKPFDQFIREHLAGDVIGGGDPRVAVGSAFLVAGPYDDVGNQDPVQAAQIRANTLDEMIRATSQGFLGLTVGCARCHDHKFDPILQSDYYALYATFAGVRHGSDTLATAEQQAARAIRLEPLERRRDELLETISATKDAIVQRAREKRDIYQARWVRPAVDRRGTEETFTPVTAKFVRLVCVSSDTDVESNQRFGIDEFEVWTCADEGAEPVNAALAANGGKATGAARHIEDFPDAYAASLAIDGHTGARFLAAEDTLTIELAEPTRIDRVLFSSARGADEPRQGKFAFVADYRIEVSRDGEVWQEVANGQDRQPTDFDQHPTHEDHRLLQLEMTGDERQRLQGQIQELRQIEREIAQVPALPSVWIGQRSDQEAAGPFHVFLGGSPQRKGEEVRLSSLAVLQNATAYELPQESTEAQRREAFATWITDPRHPLTPRVLANRVWHYHFGTGIVDTPSDFGYMGGRPTHPELLDFLAAKLIENDWRLKPIHRLVMMSEAYRQASTYREAAGAADGDSRLLWRFPPRRLSAEEVRDTMLMIAGKIQWSKNTASAVPDGGPGFRLYHFMQDNVCTYVPLDKPGPETYRRAVYHQNARASVVDLMSDFDLPDCAFGTPKRAETTTPLQALTMLNHQFTLDMAQAISQRLQRECGDTVPAQIERAFQLCYARNPSVEERKACEALVSQYGMPALCRVLLNTSELIYLR